MEGKIIRKTTTATRLIDELINMFFKNGFILFGGCIRDYIISKKKTYPHDFDIGVDDIEQAIKIINDTLGFTFNISESSTFRENAISHSKLTLEYKFSSKKHPIVLYIDIVPKSIIGAHLDFDVNSICMRSHSDYYIVCNDDSLLSLISIIENINKKKFKVMRTYSKPDFDRRQMGTKINSLRLIEYIKIMERTAKMMSRGYKLNNQKLGDIFEPMLIKNTTQSQKTSECNICSNTFKKYELELNCCKQLICFTCALNHVKGKFHNSEIQCPYCRGDPFGWNTIESTFSDIQTVETEESYFTPNRPTTIPYDVEMVGDSTETEEEDGDTNINRNIISHSYSQYTETTDDILTFMSYNY